MAKIDHALNVLQPSPSLLCKLGSIIVHVEEAHEPGGHAFDVMTTKQLLSDPEVVSWMASMRAMAMLPVKRSEPRRAQ